MILPPAPVANRAWHVSAAANLVRQLLAWPGRHDSASGAAWTDVAVVLALEVDGVPGDAGVSVVAVHPSLLSDSARVIASCGATQSLQQFIAWTLCSVPDIGLGNHPCR